MMKYKVGDKVLIKSIDWYNANKDEYGDVPCGDYDFVSLMSVFCGKILTIDVDLEDETYLMKENTGGFVFTSEMIECKVEKETLIENVDDNGLPFNEWLSHKGAFYVPENYVLKDENGNEILTSKIILEKKKEYPKTYEECCKIIHSDPKFYVDTHLYSVTLEALYKLFVCRDAYCKIAGDEMGLDKPWEPDWNDEEQDKYGFHNEVKYTIINSAMFVFPTPEMRDAFENNFGPDLEICKEFL